MGRTLLDRQIKVSRNGLVMRRADVLPLGHVERIRLVSLWVCKVCGEKHPADTQARAANELFDHWNRAHRSGDTS